MTSSKLSNPFGAGGISLVDMEIIPTILHKKVIKNQFNPMWWSNKPFTTTITAIVLGIFWSVDCSRFHFVRGWIAGGHRHLNLRDNNYKEEKMHGIKFNKTFNNSRSGKSLIKKRTKYNKPNVQARK